MTNTPAARDFSNFGSLKSTETQSAAASLQSQRHFSNFGSLKSTETKRDDGGRNVGYDFSNFGSLKSTETVGSVVQRVVNTRISAISAR